MSYVKRVEVKAAKIFEKIGVFACFLLLTVINVYIYSPVSKSHADDGILAANGSDTFASVTLDTNSLEFNVTPTTSGRFESKPITVTADTNSNAGYELFFSSEDDNTDMKSKNASVDSVITSDFDGEVTGLALPINKWGYSVDNTKFLKVPTLENRVKIVDIDHTPLDNEKNTSVYIGMKVASGLPAGKYTKGVVFTVIAHDPFIEFPDISTMQEMTPEIVKAVSIGAEKSLIDIRDGKTYTVKKMIDGNVWMTKNLGIEGKTLTPLDSDVDSNYDLPASEMFDEDVDYEIANVYVDEENKSGYYSLYAATAGSYISPANSMEKTDAASSICPKGWRLPRGTDKYGDYKKLIDMYSSSDEFIEDFSAEIVGTIYMKKIQYYGKSAALRNASSHGVLFSSGEAYTSTQNITRGFSVRCVARTDDKVKLMQGFDGEDLKVGDSVVLEDQRDHNRYNIKKLLDGKVWMVDNLRLSDKYISTIYSDMGRQPEVKVYSVPNDLSSFRSNYYGGYAYYDELYGGYYSSFNASAGSTFTNTKTGEFSKSICPKGWRIPTSSEYNALFTQYPSTFLMQQELNFNFPGYAFNQTINQQGSVGYFWSSTISDAKNAYAMQIDSLNVNPLSVLNKQYGLPVRCIVKEKEQPDGTMQTFNKDSLVKNGDEALLEDERDGNLYLVRKLKDGKVWMVENLKIEGREISSADSDMPDGESFVIPSADMNTFKGQKRDSDGVYRSKSVYLNRESGYYNFYVATAGWDLVVNENSPKSICPKGWRLPDAKEGGDFSTLFEIYKNSISIYDALSSDGGFVSTGEVYSGGRISGRHQNFNYWSSTADDDSPDRAYSFTDDLGIDELIHYDNTVSGLTIHCVAR